MKRTLVTGAAGFTGQYVGRVLANQGHELHALVHDHSGAPMEGYDATQEANLCDPNALAKVLLRVQPHYIIHLAAVAFVAHDNVDEMYDVNVLGTRNLLSALTDLRSRPQAILLASSANVYGNGNPTGGALDEQSPYAPVNDYAVTKISMEYIASIFRKELPLITVRPFNYTGRGQSTRFLIPKIVDHVQSGAEEIELGNVEVARDFSDVRTVADAYARLIKKPEAIGEVFNVCSGRAVALKEVIQIVELISGHPLKIKVNPSLVRTREVRSLLGSCKKIENLLGPLLHFSLEQTLRWMLDC